MRRSGKDSFVRTGLFAGLDIAIEPSFRGAVPFQLAMGADF
jgi:hypothetical protein